MPVVTNAGCLRGEPMSDKTIAQKLLIKEGKQVWLIRAPKGYKTALGVLPAGAKVVSKAAAPVDVIQLFVANRQELEAELPKLKALAGPQSLIWVTYLKGSSKTKTDINRDSLHAYARTI